MKSSHARSSTLAGLVVLIALAWPVSAFANQFRIYFVSRVIFPLSQDTVRVLGESAARYDGSVDLGDSTWAINAGVRDNLIGDFQFGFGRNGGNIFPGKTISCDPYQCGADVAVNRCNLDGVGNTFTVKGTCATFQPANPEIHVALRSPESLVCFPREPPEIPDENCPILIDLDKNGFHLTGIDDPVLFDIDSDGSLELVSWTDRSQLDGFLVLDVNRNGRIDGGSELFGNHSWMLDGALAEEGYQALGEYDTFTAGGNQDRVIDRNDVVFDMLRVWIDENHDGRSDPGELLTLEEAGISSIELDYVENRRRDGHGNRLRFNSRAWLADGHSHVKTTDVFFVTEDIE